MQISIDTQRDSPEELRKLIRLLSALVGDSPPASEELGSALPPASDGNVMASMFGDMPQVQAPVGQSPMESKAETKEDVALEYY